ncbi:hypothetical protein VHEMI01389 [[Torrubiella] hemipterigena]|uniref:Uncharacterized protein n=1 Tax=[Torrubiella] hemipterigena TaxID=1531966 RepID=A0A0A1T7D1_9HYPO|nr:hypothetical protein VHEMI01389 [[Torrubiella] hemipterigena]
MVLPSSFLSWLSQDATPAPNTAYLLNLLVHVLPTFAAVAMLSQDAECHNSSGRIGDNILNRREFNQEFHIKTVALHAILTNIDLNSINATADLDSALLQVLDILENSFVSWTGNAKKIADDLGLQRQKNVVYPKLCALRELLPDYKSPASFNILNSLTQITRTYSNSVSKREKILNTFDGAFATAQSLLPNIESRVDCPLLLLDYPAKGQHECSETLFTVLRKRWICECNSLLHLGRPMKLNLTQHQRFEMERVSGCEDVGNQAQFRLLFPTSAGSLRWQHADIAVKMTGPINTEVEIRGNLCRIIDEAKPCIIPKMCIFQEKLWKDRYERAGDSLLKIPNGEFETLEQLLEPGPGRSLSQIAAIDMKERLRLSFILVTSFFHIFGINHLWMKGPLTSNNICFRTCIQDFSIMKPYLDVLFVEQTPKNNVQRLDDIHWIPNLLALGILLLEICRGSRLEIFPGDDLCFTAMEVFEKWRTVKGKYCSTEIPQACFAAILACINPDELRRGNLHKNTTGDAEIRNYIFRRVLYPLGDTLSSIYKISLHQLHEDISEAFDSSGHGTGMPDSGKRMAGRIWRRNLKTLHNIFYHRRFKSHLHIHPRSASVKIAVLDTGFQVNEALLANLIDAGRIASAECKRFCRPEHDLETWNIDVDGHGTYVGQIVLDVAPTAQLYVAKVLQRREDLSSQKLTTIVQQNIADAIIFATETWNVDIIVMSFGFERKVRVISNAIRHVRKSEKPPLIFAATRNDGANKGIAWPASDMEVFGVNSTDGLGSPSPFNPADEGSDTIVYAFGEGISVEPPAGNPNLAANKEISGTSFATATAAALVANLLGFVRLALPACSPEDREIYSNIPNDLMGMSDMLKVMKKCMMREHQSGQSSLLPWDFLNTTGIEGNTILKKIYETIET